MDSPENVTNTVRFHTPKCPIWDIGNQNILKIYHRFLIITAVIDPKICLAHSHKIYRYLHHCCLLLFFAFFSFLLLPLIFVKARCTGTKKEQIASLKSFEEKTLECNHMIYLLLRFLRE